MKSASFREKLYLFRSKICFGKNTSKNNWLFQLTAYLLICAIVFQSLFFAVPPVSAQIKSPFGAKSVNSESLVASFSNQITSVWSNGSDFLGSFIGDSKSAMAGIFGNLFEESPDSTEESLTFNATLTNTITAFGPKQFIRTRGAPNNYVETFTMPSNCANGIYKLVVKNGEENGTNRVSSAEIKLNGISIFVQSDFNQNVYLLERQVTLASENTLEIRLASTPNSYLTISVVGENCGMPVDTVAPRLVITAPEDNFATTNETVTIRGTAEDTGQNPSGIAGVWVNNVPASYNATTKIWELTSVTLNTGTNTFTARTVDNAGNEATSQIVIIRDVTQPTVSIASPSNSTITQNPSIAVSGTASDTGGDASGISRVTINGTEAVFNQATGEWNFAELSLAVGANTVTATAFDRAGNQASTQITVNRVVNQPPQASAGADRTIELPNTVALNGTATDDGYPIGSSLSVSWSKISGEGDVAFSNPSNLQTTASFTTNGSYVLRLTVSDGQLTATDDINITVYPENQPPTVNAGADQTISLPNSANLNGMVTDDGLPNNNLTVSWSKIFGAGNVVFTNANATSTTATFTTEGIYILRLTASDGQSTVSDDVAVNVNYSPNGEPAPFNYRSFNDSPWLNFSGEWFYLEDFEDHALNTLGVTAETGGLVSVLFGPTAHDSVDADDGVLDGSGLNGDDFFILNGFQGIKFVFNRQILGNYPTHVGVVYTDGEGQTFYEAFDANGASLGVRGPFSFPITSHFGEVTNDFFLRSYNSSGISAIRVWSINGGGVEIDHLQYGYQSNIPTNSAPTVTAGNAQTIILPANSVTLQGAVSDDGLPTGNTLQATWTRISGDGNVVFANANQVNTTATFDQAGVYILRLTATDGELSGNADVTITVNPPVVSTPTPTVTPTPQNQPPMVEAGNNQTIILPTNSLTLNGMATDDGLPNNNLTISWTKTGGPGNVTFTNSSSAQTTATFDAAGGYVLRLTASDGLYIAYDEVAILVNPQNQPPTVNVGADQALTLAQTAILEAAVSDDGLPVGGSFSAAWTLVSGDGTVTFSNPNETATYANFSQTGIYVLRLTVSDSELSASDDVTVTVVDNQPAPTVEIITPDDGISVTEPTQISGTVSGGNWRLEYSLTDTDNLNNREWTTLATGTGAASGNLGNLDTTLMLNGLYDVRLSATDQYGQISGDVISLSVENNLKVGHFTVSFEDMNVPVAGIPIQVIRTYDSRDKRKGDFGFGWTLGIKNVRVEKNNILGLKWRQTSNGAAFPTYCVEATRPHIVTVTMPDGEVEKFEARLQQMCQQFAPLTNGYVTFAAQNGTRGRLEVVGNYVQIAGSVPGPVEFIGFDGNGIFDRTQFRYTAKDGTEFIINQNGGLQSVKDLDNNTLTISAAGILHSSGVGIAFTRDAQGRITQVTDPKGVSNIYTYDAAGDLISYKDRANNTTTFTYEPTIAHHLKSIVDPLNRTPIRNEYDASGRLLKHTDASGNEINYIHNLAARVETVTDRLGNQTTFNYDSRGNVLQQTNALGNTTNFTYDGNDNVLTETNALGKTTTSIYDQFDNRTSVTDALGNRTEFTYNNLGQVLTVKDARNNITTNTFDANGRLLKIKDAQNNETTYGYSVQSGQRTLQTDALGNQTRFEYVGNYLTKQTDAQDNETTFGYDANGNRNSQTVKRTNSQGQLETITTNFEFDNLNRLTKTTLADGTFTRTEYNTLGQQAATIDQAGNRTEFDYDMLGRLIKTTYADGKFEESTYDAEGRRLTSKDRAGRITSFEYDALGRLKKTIYSDSTFTQTNYDAAGQVLSSTDARGNSTIYTFDDAGRRLTVKNALNQITSFAYDANGNQSSMSDALNRTTSSIYDLLNRRTRTNFADSTFTETTFDVLGRRVSEKDQAGKVTQFFYDSLGRLIKVKDALNQETIYGYNELGQQILQKDALGRETKFEYDKLGRRTKRILPLGQTETYSYSTQGNLSAKTDFNGKTTSFNYDNMRRLLAKVPDASLNQPTVNFTYNDLGQRATMTDASGVTSYSYDIRNRLSSKQTPFGTLSYNYDESGSLETLRSSNANGVSIDYDYDQLNRLSSVKDNRLVGNQTTNYTYNAVGNLQSYSYPNQVTTSYAYNNLNRLTTLTVSNTTNGLASYQYTLGAAGNRTQVVEGNGRTVNYAYDDLYRLTSETIANSANNGTVSYGYDAVGNRLQRNSSVNQVANQTSTFDANDRLNSDVYDDNGNTKQSNGKNYNYDFENKLTSTSDGVGVVYDGDGNRVSKTVGGITTNYLVDTNNLTGYAQVVEEIQNNQVVKTYTYGHDLISQRQSSGVSFYNYDGHGSVRQLTNSLGNVTDTYDYDAFGNLINQTGITNNSYLYAGEQFDADLGFYYNRARYLNVQTGRFISQDSFEGSQSDPLSLHKYLYANADGVNKIDPSGNFSIVEAITVLAVVSIVATMSSCTSVFQRFNKPRNIAFNWFVNNWSVTIDADVYPLASGEIDEVKNTAMEVTRRAFADYVVTVTEGGDGNAMNVRDGILADAAGQTLFGGAVVSTIFYDSIRTKASQFASEGNITDRAAIVRGIGRAIGNTAAHEFLHQLGLSSADSSIDRLSYDYHAFDRSEQFYGEDFHFTPLAKQQLDRKLLIKDR